MKLLQVSALFLLAGAAAACSKDSTGTQVTPDSLAGLRYVNLVPDTSAVDFRIIDVVAGAPNQVGATFRTGGSPEGVSTGGFLPLHQEVAAGTRHIRVFMNGGNPAVSSQILFDTSFTFRSGKNYTFYLFGYARTASTPQVNALITLDSVPAMSATQFAIRTINLAPTTAPTLAAGNVDVFVDTLAAASNPAGTATFSNVAFGEVRAYSLFTARPAAGVVPALGYRGVIAATATTTPFVQVAAPAGTVGNSTTQPIPGVIVAGTAFTALIVPPSVTGSTATAFATPSVLYMIDQLPPRTAP